MVIEAAALLNRPVTQVTPAALFSRRLQEEIPEPEFKKILEAKPDYKTLLRTLNGAENVSTEPDRYAYRIVLDLKKVSRVW